MLTIVIPAVKHAWNEATNKFVSIPETTLNLEHSLISISKWEMKYHKVYISKRKKTDEETLDYIRFMTINKVNDYVYYFLTDENIKAIKEYIADPMTALVFPEEDNGSGPFTNSNKVMSNETIYYLMISYGIPIEFQKWHINKLLALLKVFELRNKPKDKRHRNTKNLASHYAKLNAERRAKYNSKG